MLPLLYLPVLLRARLSLLWAAGVSLLAYVGLSFAWLLALEATQVTWFTLSEIQNRAATLSALVLLGGFLVLLVSAYVLALFEFALREARACDEVEAKQRELEGALERVRSLGELEVEHASLTERARISRELHDTLGHHLTAQRYDLQFALWSRSGDAEERGALERALTRNEEAIADVRLAVNVMKPRPSGEDLLTSLRRLVSAWPDKANICLEVMGRKRPLPEDVHLALYRAAQECMTNARRRAPGERLTLGGTFGEDAVVLEARNLVGRVLVRANDTGQGLASLARRAEVLRGEAHSGVQGSQFMVRLRVPA